MNRDPATRRPATRWLASLWPAPRGRALPAAIATAALLAAVAIGSQEDGRDPAAAAGHELGVGPEAPALDAPTEAWLAGELERQRRSCEEALERERREHAIELATLREELAARGGTAGIDPWDEVARLRVELDRERAERLAREEEWLRFTSALDALSPGRAAFGPRFSPQAPLLASFPAPATPVQAKPEGDRAAEVFRALRTLLAVEGVRGLDLVSATALADGAIGPVLFRLLDERGRLSGSLWAARLRLEGSRAGRSLTLVLEDGYEMHAGIRVPFDEDPAAPRTGREHGGERRIVLPYVDPMPWVERLPELFGDDAPAERADDGRWNKDSVQVALNGLLREDVAEGWWRLKRVGAIRDDVLRDVHLERLDRDGRVERRLFADSMSILPAERGVQILLQDGVQVRGDRKAAFLDGRFRIFLPRADPERWRAAGLPGLSEPPAAGDVPPAGESR